MTDAGYRHITILVDRSGSMEDKKNDMEGGLAAFLAEQAREAVRTTVSLHEFDTEFDTVYDLCDIGRVPEYRLRPRGGTALLDAVGRTVGGLGEQLSQLPEDRRPGAIVVVIATDGEENASHGYTRETVREMVAHQEGAYGWHFLFLGAGIDAFDEAGGIGLRRGQTMSVDSGGYRVGWNLVSQTVSGGVTGRSYNFDPVAQAAHSNVPVPGGDTDPGFGPFSAITPVPDDDEQ